MALERHRATPDAREKNPDKREATSYTLESGITVELKATKFENESQEGSGGKAVVFLTGWAMSEEDRGTVRLGRSFARESQGPSYAISARSVERGQSGNDHDFLKEEAKGVARFIKDHGISNVTLAGYSQGGDRIVHLAAELQNDPDIKVGGLVLIAPLGLHDETLGGRIGTFAKHSMIDTPLAVLKTGKVGTIATGTRVLGATALNIATEVWKSGTTYPKRLMSEIGEMTKVNPRLAELSMPIVLVLGAVDPVSDRERTVPLKDEQQVRLELGEKAGERDKTFAGRETFLKEHMFPKSPYVRMIVPEKEGWHTLPHFRPESVARASLYLLRRHDRTQENTEK